MPRLKRSSFIIEKAGARAAALTSIDPKLVLSEDLSVPAYAAKITAAQNKLNAHNALIHSLDTSSTDLDLIEEDLADWTERMLKGVATRFGRKSDEYAKAGGTRKSEIRRARKSNITSLPAPKSAAA